MFVFKSGVIVFALTLIAGTVSAQVPGRIATMTRTMKVFSGMEDRLDAAVRKNDSQALSALLSPEFQVWTPQGTGDTGDPIPRDEWLKRQSQCETKPASIRNMAVRDVGETQIVSFVQSREMTCGGHLRGSADFIVDIWQKSGDSWTLTDRYMSPTKMPSGPRRPTGKE